MTTSLLGCRPCGPPHTVTGTDGTLLTGLDHTSALEIYQQEQRDTGGFSREIRPGEGVRAFALRLRPSDPDEAAPLLAIYGTDQERGALALAVHLDEGDVVELVEIDLEVLRREAPARLDAALARLGAPPTALLLADCYGWKVLLQSATGAELAPISARLPEVPLVGMYSGGEIGQLCLGDGDGHSFANYILSLAVLGAP